MNETHQILTCIAEALGVPVETFTGPFAESDAAMLGELISMWLSLGRGADRNKVLGYTRAILAAQQQVEMRR